MASSLSLLLLLSGCVTTHGQADGAQANSKGSGVRGAQEGSEQRMLESCELLTLDFAELSRGDYVGTQYQQA